MILIVTIDMQLGWGEMVGVGLAVGIDRGVSSEPLSSSE